MEELLKKKNNEPFVENRCFDCNVRLIDTSNTIEKNKYYESISMTEAQNIAKASQMDLVCFERQTRDKLGFYKVMNFGKWKYDTAKKKKQQQKQNKKTTKEIRLSINIDSHDLEHKIKQANKFLDGGDEVMFSMRLKGRDRLYSDDAKVKLIEMAEMCDNVEILHKKLDGKNYFTVRVGRKKAK